MNFLVGMETSGATRNALRKHGIEAWSCDMLPSVDNSPYHIIGDVFDYLDCGWDAALFHPTCTYMTNSAEWAYKDPDFARYPGVGYHMKLKPGTLFGAERRAARERALDDVRRLLACKIKRKAIENPRGVIGSRIRPATQILQPYDLGDDASKATCLWLDELPAIVLDPGRRFPGRWVWDRGRLVERWSNQTDSGQNRLPPSDGRWSERSKTFPGIADAFGSQWAAYLLFRC